MPNTTDTGFDRKKYKFGTDFYLYNNYAKKNEWGEPIVYDIQENDGIYKFIPNIVEKSNKSKYPASLTLNNKSVLGGCVQALSLFIKYAHDITKNTYDKKSIKKMFYWDNIKPDSIKLYISYTNNMPFKDDPRFQKIDFYTRGVLHDYTTYNNNQPDDLFSIDFNPPYEILNLKYSNDDEKIASIIKNFNSNIAYNKNIDVLSAFGFKEGECIANKLVIYGVAPKWAEGHKFIDTIGYGVCAILYIEHKITGEEILKFRKLCNEQLEAGIVKCGTDKDINYILNITPEQIRRDYNINNFSEFYKLACACGYVKEPAGLRRNFDKHIDSEFGFLSNDWESLKKYYSEMYNSFKIIMNYYVELSNIHTNNIRTKYLDRVNNMIDTTIDNLDSGDIYKNKTYLAKYIRQVLNELDDVHVDDWDEFILSAISVQQEILIKIGEFQKQDIINALKKYRLLHPRAKKAQIPIKNFSDQITKQTSITFPYNALPAELIDNNDPHFAFIFNNLTSIVFNFIVWPAYYVNGHVIKKRKNIYGDNVLIIENIDDALNGLEIGYAHTNWLNNILPVSFDNLYWRRYCSKYENDNKSIVKDIINSVISAGPIKFKLKTDTLNGLLIDRNIHIKQPVDHSEPRGQFQIIGDSTVDNLLNNLELSQDNIIQKLMFSICVEFDKDAIKSKYNEIMAKYEKLKIY